MKRRLIVLLVFAVVGVGVYYFLNRPVHEIVLTGIVTTDDVIVSSQVAGRLQKVMVTQGDAVKANDPLAVIEPEAYQADMSFYSNSERGAATQVSQANANLEFAQAQTEQQIAQAEATRAASQAQVTAAEADLENARLTFTREETAYKQGAESIQTYDQARTAYDAQKARVEALRKEAIASAAAVELAKANLKQVEVRRQAVAMDEHQLAATTAQSEKAKVQLGYTDIRAPIAGIVDVRAALQGEVVAPGQAIVTLVDPDNLWVRVDIEETYIDRVHLGDTMQVRLPSGGVREGKVIFRGVDAEYATQRDVSRTKRDIKTFEVRLRCDNADRALALGMTAYVDMPLPPPAGAK